eukprot:2279382-Prymnesium_polylepis.1
MNDPATRKALHVDSSPQASGAAAWPGPAPKWSYHSSCARADGLNPRPCPLRPRAHQAGRPTAPIRPPRPYAHHADPYAHHAHTPTTPTRPHAHTPTRTPRPHTHHGPNGRPPHDWPTARLAPTRPRAHLTLTPLR